jgi:hypothetical protein
MAVLPMMMTMTNIIHSSRPKAGKLSRKNDQFVRELYHARQHGTISVNAIIKIPEASALEFAVECKDFIAQMNKSACAVHRSYSGSVHVLSLAEDIGRTEVISGGKA